MKTYGQLLLGAAALIAVFAAASAVAEDADPPTRLEDLSAGLEAGPVDPYIPVPESEHRTVPARQWRRGPFTSIQVNIDASGFNIVGDAANEPSIAVDPRWPNRLAIGWRQFDTITSNFRQAGIGFSTDGGRTWTAGVLDPGVFRSDPVLDFAADGTFYYDSLRYIEVPETLWSEFSRSPNAGATWGSFVYAMGGDKPWMTVDRTGGGGNGNIYQTWWGLYSCCANDDFTRSRGGAASFETPVAMPDGPHFGTASVRHDGTLLVAGVGDLGTTVVRSSTVQNPAVPLGFDGATTVDMGGDLVVLTGPNPEGLTGQMYVTTDHSGGVTHGNVYVLASVDPPGSDPLDVHFARSTDGGLTWSPAMRINDDAGDNWQWFGTISVAPNGRIDVIWNDTRVDPGGYWSELYYRSSSDGGINWSPNTVVSADFDPHLGWPSQNKLGDYYDMVSDDVGVHVAYAATFNGEQDVYYLRIGDYDCNANGVGDTDDILQQFSLDLNQNGIPDECEALLFADGFELGDATVWTIVNP